MPPSAAERGKSYYRVLGLPECTPIEGVKRKFKELALKLHPDKNLDDPMAVERFQSLNTAYEALSNPEKKKLMDDALVLAETTLSAPESLQTAASLFRKQHTSYHEELNAFRSHRRANSQSTRASAAASAAMGSDRRSQYTKEQTDYFRQREKEREREMVKRMERERENQRESELEKYRASQEERLREEERRAKEARQKMDKAEAALYHATMAAAAVKGGVGGFPSSPVGAGGSFRGLQRRDTQHGHRSASCEAVSSPTSSFQPSKMISPNTPRPANVQSNMSTPRNGFVKRSPSWSTSQSPLESRLEYPHLTPASSPLDTAQATDAPLSAKVKKERERQEEHRRLEQERYLQRKLSDIRDREAQRARHAAEEELRLYQRELQLVEDNEYGERKQFLEQEEELERRMLLSSFRRVENSLSVQSRAEPLMRREVSERCSLQATEDRARNCLAVALHSGLVRSEVTAQEASLRFALEREWFLEQERRRCFHEEANKIQRLEHSIRQRSEGEALFMANIIFLSVLLEPAHRSLMQSQVDVTYARLMRACSLLHQLYTTMFVSRRAIEVEERRQRDVLSITTSEALRRCIILETEIDSFVHAQRCRGQNLIHVMQAQAREHEAELELVRLRHDAEVTKLIEELARLHQQLGGLRSPQLGSSGTTLDNPHMPSSGGSTTYSPPRRKNAPGSTKSAKHSAVEDATQPTGDANAEQQRAAGSSSSLVLLYPPEIPIDDRGQHQLLAVYPEAHSITSTPQAWAREVDFSDRPLAHSPSHSQHTTNAVAHHHRALPFRDSAKGANAGDHPACSNSASATSLVSTPLLRSKQWGGNAPNQLSASGKCSVFTTPPPGIRRSATSPVAEL